MCGRGEGVEVAHVWQGGGSGSGGGGEGVKVAHVWQVGGSGSGGEGRRGWKWHV